MSVWLFDIISLTRVSLISRHGAAPLLLVSPLGSLLQLSLLMLESNLKPPWHLILYIRGPSPHVVSCDAILPKSASSRRCGAS